MTLCVSDRWSAMCQIGYFKPFFRCHLHRCILCPLFDTITLGKQVVRLSKLRKNRYASQIYTCRDSNNKQGNSAMSAFLSKSNLHYQYYRKVSLPGSNHPHSFQNRKLMRLYHFHLSFHLKHSIFHLENYNMPSIQ